MREMSAEDRGMELHGDGRQELQGREIQMELHGEGRREYGVDREK